MRHTTEKLRFDASLMPVLFWRYKTAKKDNRNGLFGLCGSTSYRHSPTNTDKDFGLFPFLYYGQSPEEKDRYFMLWPLGGTLKGKLGYEKMTTALFPGVLLFVFFPPAQIISWTTTAYVVLSLLPLYVSYSRKDYRAWGLMWPVFMRGKSKLRDDIRIMPFYAHKKKKGWYDRYSILMIINFSKEYFSKDVRHMFFFFPFFGRKWSDSGRISSYTILWPFFSWGYDKKN